MSTLNERHTLAEQVAQAMGKSVYNNVEAHKDITPAPRTAAEESQTHDARRGYSPLGTEGQGMTISFHHHFRGGDKVVNMGCG